MQKPELIEVQDQTFATVYRIEHKDSGWGIYRGGGYNYNPIISDYHHSAPKRHPLPYNDSLLVENGPKDRWGALDIRDMHFFGFSSKEQLRAWLYEDVFLTDLHDHGFVMKTFVVPVEHFFLGHTQVVFVRQEAISSTEHSLLEYFNLSRK